MREPDTVFGRPPPERGVNHGRVPVDEGGDGRRVHLGAPGTIPARRAGAPPPLPIVDTELIVEHWARRSAGQGARRRRVRSTSRHGRGDGRAGDPSDVRPVART
ncbi:hypothetical protein GCM10023200_50230 [Actinomycetospora chlora]|uniref:Type II toxin-antitoxin system VapC family toxin n=1 Tax=Actinomycetospora chlora TaxID=663608 RepID=A0ABP9CBU9_9PSEU